MLEAQKVQDAMESLMSMSSAAMDGHALNLVVQKTEVLHGVFFKLCDLIKTQQRNYADLSIRYAFDKHRLEMIDRQRRGAAGNLFVILLLL